MTPQWSAQLVGAAAASPLAATAAPCVVMEVMCSWPSATAVIHAQLRALLRLFSLRISSILRLDARESLWAGRARARALAWSARVVELCFHSSEVPPPLHPLCLRRSFRARRAGGCGFSHPAGPPSAPATPPLIHLTRARPGVAWGMDREANPFLKDRHKTSSRRRTIATPRGGQERRRAGCGRGHPPHQREPRLTHQARLARGGGRGAATPPTAAWEPPPDPRPWATRGAAWRAPSPYPAHSTHRLRRCVRGSRLGGTQLRGGRTRRLDAAVAVHSRVTRAGMEGGVSTAGRVPRAAPCLGHGAHAAPTTHRQPARPRTHTPTSHARATAHHQQRVRRAITTPPSLRTQAPSSLPPRSPRSRSCRESCHHGTYRPSSLPPLLVCAPRKRPSGPPQGSTLRRRRAPAAVAATSAAGAAAPQRRMRACTPWQRERGIWPPPTRQSSPSSSAHPLHTRDGTRRQPVFPTAHAPSRPPPPPPRLPSPISMIMTHVGRDRTERPLLSPSLHPAPPPTAPSPPTLAPTRSATSSGAVMVAGRGGEHAPSHHRCGRPERRWLTVRAVAARSSLYPAPA